MDSLLAPEDVIASFAVNGQSQLETKIPIPSPDFLKKPHKITSSATPLTKYAKEFEKFCEWSALPKELRKPPDAKGFERKYMLPKGYTNYFKGREDYRDKTLTYFWEWMMDLYPEVVHATYKRAIAKSDKAATLFIELMNKHMNLDKPKVQVQPMILMGVPSEKIDALFTPKGYTEAIIPGEKKSDK